MIVYISSLHKNKQDRNNLNNERDSKTLNCVLGTVCNKKVSGNFRWSGRSVRELIIYFYNNLKTEERKLKRKNSERFWTLCAWGGEREGKKIFGMG